VGLHLDEEPRLRRHPLRRGADRAGHREHDARGDDKAYQDHGEPKQRLQSGLEDAARVLHQLELIGIDYVDLTDTLEREGVEKFAGSFRELMQALEQKRGSLAVA
jgi:hypothetical protein